MDQQKRYGKKTISSDYGDCEISVPRDRNGEIEPKVNEKRQTCTDEIEKNIMAMYAKGISQRDIEDTLRDIYGSEIPQSLISRIADKILPEMNEWQNRPLDSIYPVIFFDGIVFNSRKFFCGYSHLHSLFFRPGLKNSNITAKKNKRKTAQP